MPMRELRHLLDPGVDSVKPFQVVVYAGYLGAGVHALVTGTLPNAVEQVLGPTAHHVWVALLIACPLLTFVGIPIARRTPRGPWLQIAGDTGIAFASAVYALALAQTVYVGRATFALWIVLALAICAAALAGRNLRTLRAVHMRARRPDRG